MTESIAKYGPREKFVHPPKKDGVAQYNYANPLFTYIGEWKDGKKEGKGKFMVGKNSYYEGEFLHGEITGKGKRVFPNGSVYEGEFKLGEFCGNGKYIDKITNEVYEGGWKDNKRNGEGVLSLPDGTTYSGSFVNHKRNGFGKYTSSSGNTYEGQWIDNMIQGKGKMIYANGDVYEGEFVDGKKQGQGTIVWADSGLSVSSEWKDDKCVYNPTNFVISELPPFTPGQPLHNITVSIEGGKGECGRVIKVQIEIGRIDPNAVTKKASKPKKNEVVDKEPKYFVLNKETQETSLKITTQNGVALIPQIEVPLETEQNTYTLIIDDMSEKAPLPQAISDFTFVAAVVAKETPEKPSVKAKAPAKRQAPKSFPRRK